MEGTPPDRLPVSPEGSSVPLLPFGSDGVWKSPPHWPYPEANLRISCAERDVNAVERRILCHDAIIGGEGGIRTHGALRLTRSPGARVRPDYATSPERRRFGPAGRRREL